jgi:hypothetical protein
MVKWKNAVFGSTNRGLSLLCDVIENPLVDGIGVFVKTNEEYRLYVTAKRSGRSDGGLRCTESGSNFQRPAVTRCN